MGQKTDARIFRQGVLKKNWELKHLEKNNEESSLYLYKTLEIQKYLNRFFGLYKIKVQNCKIFYSDSCLQIFVSFYLTTKTIYIINKKLTKYSKKRTRHYGRTFFRKRKRKWQVFSKKKTKRLFEQKKLKPKSQKVTKHYPKYSKLAILKKKKLLKRKRLKLKAKKFQKIKNKKNLTSNGLKRFQEILTESLATYTKNKTNISVTLQNLNRYKQLSHTQVKNLVTIFKQLKKFTRSPFFKEAINILFVNISKRKSAKLLAEFISDQLRLNQLRTDQMTISRKDNYFLGFLKQTIMLLVKSEISRLKGIKITVKGRFNRAPRARARHIYFGKFSLQSFESKIDYYQSTAYTINGTFGVKVWLCENEC